MIKDHVKFVRPGLGQKRRGQAPVTRVKLVSIIQRGARKPATVAREQSRRTPRRVMGARRDGTDQTQEIATIVRKDSTRTAPVSRRDL